MKYFLYLPLFIFLTSCALPQPHSVVVTVKVDPQNPVIEVPIEMWAKKNVEKVYIRIDLEDLNVVASDDKLQEYF